MFAVAAPVMALTTPFASHASAINCEKRLFGIPPWYKGLTEVTQSGGGDQCTIISPNQAGGLQSFITKIVLNIIEIGLVIVGYVAVFFILYGGFLFLTGGGNPSQIEKARKTILNAVIGLIISIGAVAIVNLIFGVLK